MFSDQVVNHFIHYLCLLFLSDASMKTIIYMSSVKKGHLLQIWLHLVAGNRSEWVGEVL
jgi:hypothetical protein